MSQKQSLLFFLVAFVVLLLIYLMGGNAKKAYFDEKEQLATFEKEAKSLGGLKKKFGDKAAMQRSIKSLNRLSPASKDFKKSDVRVLVYENLSPTTLNNLLRKVQNSTLNLKKLEVTRLSPQSATLKLEIKQ